MGWLDRATAACFKKDPEGRDLFFPCGNLGAGRIVPSAADAVWVRSYLKIYFVCLVITAVPMLVLGRIFRTSVDLATVAPFVGAYFAVLILPWIVLWLRVRSWPIAGQREMSVQDAMSRSANEAGSVLLWIGVIGGGLMVASSLFVLFITDEIVGALLCLAFSGACFGFAVWLLRARQRG